MPKPNIVVDWNNFGAQTARLRQLISSISPLSVNHRKLVAEIVMVRLFLLTENTVGSICAKLLCGAHYLDGTAPQTMVQASSTSSARVAMLQFRRPNPKRQLSWTQSKEIRDNLKHTVQPSDPVFVVVRNHASELTEMRYVRNHIAHKNNTTRENFRKVIRQHYGGLKKGVTPGLLLLTNATGSPPLMAKYLAYCRIFVKDLVRG